MGSNSLFFVHQTPLHPANKDIGSHERARGRPFSQNLSDEATAFTYPGFQYEEVLQDLAVFANINPRLSIFRSTVHSVGIGHGYCKVRA